MPVTPITDLGTAVMTGLAAAFAGFMLALPSVIGALLLLAIGWIVAGAIGGVLARFLRAVRINELAERAGVTRFLQRAKLSADPAAVIGGLVKWWVRLVFVLMAANAVGLTAVSGVVGQILAFIPNLLVALLFLGAFSWLASLAKDLVTGAVESAGMPNAKALGTLTFATVMAFGIVAAANQIGVAATLINTLFMGVVGALALAFGLAFGLGGRDHASSMLGEWRGRASQLSEGSSQPNQGSSGSILRPALAGNGRPEREERPVR